MITGNISGTKFSCPSAHGTAVHLSCGQENWSERNKMEWSINGRHQRHQRHPIHPSSLTLTTYLGASRCLGRKPSGPEHRYLGKLDARPSYDKNGEMFIMVRSREILQTLDSTCSHHDKLYRPCIIVSPRAVLSLSCDPSYEALGRLRRAQRLPRLFLASHFVAHGITTF